MLTLDEILTALAPAWQYANETEIDGTFIRPEYRKALDAAWAAIVIASEDKPKELHPHLSLNVAMVKREVRA